MFRTIVKVLWILFFPLQIIFSQESGDISINTRGSTGDNSYNSYNIECASAGNYGQTGGIVVRILNNAAFSSSDSIEGKKSI